MDQQEEGWPLGLQPLSSRLGLIRNLDFFESVSFSSVITGTSRSTSSSLTSSDFDSESSVSLSQERNVTLGSFIGIRGSILEMSRSSFRRGRRHENLTEKKGKSKTWFSLCTKPRLELEKGDGSASLGLFLEMERKSCSLHGSSRVRSNCAKTHIFFRNVDMGNSLWSNCINIPFHALNLHS